MRSIITSVLCSCLLIVALGGPSRAQSLPGTPGTTPPPPTDPGPPSTPSDPTPPPTDPGPPSTPSDPTPPPTDPGPPSTPSDPTPPPTDPGPPSTPSDPTPPPTDPGPPSTPSDPTPPPTDPGPPSTPSDPTPPPTDPEPPSTPSDPTPPPTDPEPPSTPSDPTPPPTDPGPPSTPTDPAPPPIDPGPLPTPPPPSNEVALCGQVRDENGGPLPDVRVTYGDIAATVSDDVGGRYCLSVRRGLPGRLRAHLEGRTFRPSAYWLGAGRDNNGLDFEAVAVTIPDTTDPTSEPPSSPTVAPVTICRRLDSGDRPLAPNLQVKNLRATSEIPEDPACQAPEPVHSFLNSVPEVGLFFELWSAQAQDHVRVEFASPTGEIYREADWHVTDQGDYCFWSRLAIAGEPAAELAGIWTVRVLVNQKQVAVTRFSVAAVRPSTKLELLNVISSAAGVFGKDCDSPVFSAFVPPDGSEQHTWFLFETTDVHHVTLDYFTPGGDLFTRFAGETFGSGVQCMWSNFKVPFDATGEWSVAASVDSEELFQLSFLVAPAILEAATMTRTLPESCSSPAYQRGFLANDPGYLWFLIREAEAGAVVQAEWESPSGQVRIQDLWPPLDEAGDWCFWAEKPSVGPAGFGEWRIRISLDEADLGTHRFHVAPIRVDSILTTLSYESCARPTPARSFGSADDVLVWFSAQTEGMQPGDEAVVRWIAPGGATQTKSWRLETGDLPDRGAVFPANLHLADSPPGSATGQRLTAGAWEVQIDWNGQLAASTTFFVDQPPGPVLWPPVTPKAPVRPEIAILVDNPLEQAPGDCACEHGKGKSAEPKRLAAPFDPESGTEGAGRAPKRSGRPSRFVLR